jgi:hypothetical protein
MADETAEQIWVTTKEGAEMTGYSQEYLERLANKNWRQPETERLIQVRNRSGRYELWLPDLLQYMAEHGTGPQIHTRRSEGNSE